MMMLMLRSRQTSSPINRPTALPRSATVATSLVVSQPKRATARSVTRPFSLLPWKSNPHLGSSPG